MQWTPPPENNTIHADFDSLLVCGTKQNMINPNRNPNFFNERIHTEPPISMHEYVQKEGNYDTLIENQLEEYSKIKLSVESNIRYDHLKKLINIPLAKKHDFDDQNQACTSGKIPNNNDEENNVSFNIAQKNLQNIKQQESEVQKPIDSNTPTEFRIGMNFSQDLMSIIHDNHLNSANKPCEKFAVNENFAGLEVKLKNHSSPELQNTNTKMSDGLDSQETVIEIHRSIQNENTGIEKKRRQLIASNHIYSSSSDSSNDEITQLVDEMVGSGFSS